MGNVSFRSVLNRERMMISTRTTKHTRGILLIAVFCLAIGVSGFSGGVVEGDMQLQVTDPNSQTLVETIIIKAVQDGGHIKFKLHHGGEDPEASISQVLYRYDGGSWRDFNETSLVYRSEAYQPTFQGGYDFEASLPWGKNLITDIGYTNSAPMFLLPEERASTSVSWPDELLSTPPATGSSYTLEILYKIAGGANDGKVRGIRLAIEPEYFQGEKAAIDKVTNLNSYTAKAFALLGAILFPEGELSAYLSTLGTHGLLPPGITTDQVQAGIVSLRSYPSVITAAREGLRDVLWQQLHNRFPVSGEEEITRFDLSEGGFSQLYGSTLFNPYISAYLSFLFDRGLPPLASVLEQFPESIAGIDQDDWRVEDSLGNLRQFTDDEAKSFARAALRYTTWGAPYTPIISTSWFKDPRLVSNRSAMREIANWLQNLGSDNDRISAETNWRDATHVGELPMVGVVGGSTKEYDILDLPWVSANQVTLFPRLPMRESGGLPIRALLPHTARTLSPDSYSIYIKHEIGSPNEYTDSQYILKNGKLEFDVDNSPVLDGNSRLQIEERSGGTLGPVGGVLLVYSVDESENISLANSSTKATAEQVFEDLKIKHPIIGGGVRVADSDTLIPWNKVTNLWFSDSGGENTWTTVNDSGSSETKLQFQILWQMLNNKYKKNEIRYAYLSLDSTEHNEISTIEIEHILNEVAEVQTEGGASLQIPTTLRLREVFVFDGDPVDLPGEPVEGQVYEDATIASMFSSVTLNKRFWEGGEIVPGSSVGVTDISQIGRALDYRGTDLDVLTINRNEDSPHFSEMLVLYTDDIASENTIVSLPSSNETDFSTIVSVLEAGIDAQQSIGNIEIPPLDTPFVSFITGAPSDLQLVYQGYPLPYTSFGIDTPVLFAAKMMQQTETKRVLAEHEAPNSFTYRFGTNPGLLARINGIGPEAYFTGYALPRDGDPTKNLHYPFLPGYRALDGSNLLDPSHEFTTHRLAGTDSIGLVTGALTMVPGIDVPNFLSAPSEVGSGSVDALRQFSTLQNTALAEVAEKGKVRFWLDDAGSESYHTKYRISSEVLEYQSLVVPRLSDVRVGDILMRPSSSTDRLAVVVSIPSEFPDNAFETMQNILIVTSDPEVGYATAQSWASISNPFSYHIRRLLVKNSVPSVVQALPENQQLIRPGIPGGVQVALITDGSAFGSKGFLPVGNTGEFLTLKRIQFSQGEEERELPRTSRQVRVLPPEDPYAGHENAEGKQTNIYRNTGSGFIFGAIREQSGGRGSFIPLVVFERQENPSDVRFPYRAIYDYVTGEPAGSLAQTLLRQAYGLENHENLPPSPLRADGRPRDGIELTVGYSQFGTGKDLQLRMDNQELFPGELSSFGLRPYGVIHPGDDLLLRFEVAGSLSSQVEGTIVTTAQDEMIAVIDHKALWRANLYISEQSSDDNPVVDWNNENPWDAHPDYKTNPDQAPWWWDESYGVNDWQESQAYHTPAGTVAGGQVIKFSGFSSIRSEGRTDRVAYDYPIVYGTPEKWYGGIDTPIEFQQRMESQRDAIKEWFNPDGLNNSPPAGMDNSISTQLSSWNQTKAPADEWRNYVPASWGAFPTVVNELTHTPYLPGIGLTTFEGIPYSSSMVIGESEASTIAGDMASGNTLRWAQLMAGVDCIGLAQRVFDYSEDLYTWNTLGPNGAYRTYPWYSADAALKAGRGTHSELIVGSGSSALEKIRNLSYIKPGDVLYYLDGILGAHIAIVQKVDRQPDGSVVAGGIHLIEATFDGNVAYVVNPGIDDTSRTLQKIIDNGKTWRVVRLNMLGIN